MNRNIFKRVSAMLLAAVVTFGSVQTDVLAAIAKDEKTVEVVAEEVMDAANGASIVADDIELSDPEILVGEEEVSGKWKKAVLKVEDESTEDSEEAVAAAEDDCSTAAKREGDLVPTQVLADEYEMEAEALPYKDKKALLIQDNVPWTRGNDGNEDSNQVILKQLVSYDVTTTTAFPTLDLTDYSAIFFANDQTISTYDEYAKIAAQIQRFGELGGIIYFGAADGGWANGDLNAALPGGVEKVSRYTYANEIVDDEHPIVTGKLTDGKALTNDLLSSNYCSHAYFKPETFPEGTKVILQEKGRSDCPTLIEYPLGNGRVIASTLTWEHNLNYGGTESRFHPFAERAMDDLYSYVLFSAGIGNENIQLVVDERIPDSDHMIIVADESDRKLLEGATVKFGTKTGVTDSNGKVIFKNIDEGSKVVTVSKTGYQTKTSVYKALGGEMHNFYLVKKDRSDAYTTGITVDIITKSNGVDVVRTEDITTKNVTIEKDKKYVVHVNADWNGQEAGHYVLFNDTQYAYSLNGDFTIDGTTGECSNSKGVNPKFSAGSLNVRLETKDGNKSKTTQTRLYMRASSSGEFGKVENNKKFQLGKKFGFTVPEDFPVIGDMDFYIGLDNIPVSYEVTDDEIKLAIGITDFTELEKPGKSWEDYKKKFEVVKKTKDLREFNKLFGGKGGSFNIKKGWKPDCSVVGYASGKYDPDTGEITQLSGGLITTLSADYTCSNQYLVGPVPVYLEIGGGVSLECETNIKGIFIKEAQLVVNNKFTVTPKFVIGGGVGIDGALSVGAKGEAKLPITLYDQKWNASTNSYDSFTNIKLSGEMKLEASALFVLHAEKSIAKGEWQILRYYYDTGETEWFSKGAGSQEVNFYDANSYTMMDRTETGEWYTELMEAAALQDGMTVLQDGILPTTELVLEKLSDDSAILLFQQDIASRTQANRTCLMYSIYKNGVWSTPQAVWDNGKADMSASVVKAGDSVYVVWQKAKIAYSNDATMTDMAAGCEIAVAKLDKETGEFVAQEYITDDEIVQMMPKVAYDGEEAYAVYVENENNNILGTISENGIGSQISEVTDPGEYVIKAKKIGSEDEPVVIHRGNEYVSDLAACFKNGKLNVAYILDEDAGLYSKDDKEVYVNEDGIEKRLTENRKAESNLQYVKGKLYWYQDNSSDADNVSEDAENVSTAGAIYVYAGTSPRIYVSKDIVPGANFRVMEAADKTSVMWISTNAEEKKCIYGIVKTEEGWTDPIELCATENDILKANGYLKDDGSWEFVATEDKLISGSNYKTMLVYSGVKPRILSSVDNMLFINKSANEPDNKVSFQIKNKGESLIEELNLELRDEENKLVYSRKVPCLIKGGETVTLDAKVDVPVLKKPVQYSVLIYPEGENEEDLEDNSGFVKAGCADLVVKLDQYACGKTNVVNAIVYNDSDMESKGVLLVRLDDPTNGEIVERVILGNIAAGSKRVISYTYDLTNFDFNEQRYRDLYYHIRGDVEEEFQENNIERIILENPYYTEDGEMETPTALNVNVPDPLILTLGKEKTYQIETNITPSSSAKWPLIYKSSNEGVVIVNDEGVLEAMKEGTATVTVKAANTDLTKTVNVKVTGTGSRKISMELEEHTVETSCYQVGDEYVTRLYADGSEKPLDNALFNFTSSDDEIASVAAGNITCLKPGRVTINAALKADADVKTSLVMNIVAKKVGRVEMIYTVNDEERSASQMDVTPTELADMSIKLTPKAYAENGEEMPDAEFLFQASNPAVVNVKYDGTIQRGSSEGVGIVKAKAKNSEAYANLTFYVFTAGKPVLVTDENLKVNILSTEGASFEMQMVGPGSLSYSSYLYKKSNGKYVYDYSYQLRNSGKTEDGRYTYKVTSYSSWYTPKKGTYYAKFTVGSKTYYQALKITPTKSMPSVKVSISKFNVFDKNAYGKVTYTSSVPVSSVYMYSDYNYKLTNSGFTLTDSYSKVVPTYTLENALKKGTKFSKINRKVNMTIYLSGYSQPIYKTVTIPASYTKPTLSLSNKNFLVNDGLPADVGTKLTLKNGKTVINNDWSTTNVSITGISASTPYVDETGYATFNIPGYTDKTLKGKVSVTRDDWRIPVTAEVVLKKASSYSIKTDSTITVKPGLGLGGKSTVSVKDGQRLEVYGDDSTTTDSLFDISFVDGGIAVTPTAAVSSYKKKDGKYSYKVDVYDKNGNSLGKCTVSIKVDKKMPSLSMPSKTYYLDMSQVNRSLYAQVKGDLKGAVIDTDKSTYTVKSGDEVSEAIGIDISEKGLVTIKSLARQEAGASYSVEINPVTNEDVALSAIKFTVKSMDGHKIGTKVSGKIDSMKRTSSTAKVELSIKNDSAKLEKVSIRDEITSDFEVRKEGLTAKKPYVTIGIKPGRVVAGGTRDTVLSIKMTDGSVTDIPVKVKVTASKCKISATKAIITDALKDSTGSGKISLSPSSNNDIESITQLDNLNYFTVTDGSFGKYNVTIKDKGFTPKKTYKIKCRILTTNDLKGSAGTVVTLNVQVK